MNARPALPRLLAIMGSGETAPTMVRVHRRLLELLGPPPVPAVLLDTPFGFQENAREIAGRAVTYFRESLQTTIAVTGMAAVTAGAASVQVAGSFGNDTNVLQSNPATTNVATSPGSIPNSALAEAGTNEPGMEPTLGEPFVPSRELWLSDVMAINGGAGLSVVDPAGVQFQREILFHNLDLLLQADTPSAPVYFGVDSEVKFVEHHNYQPGIPVPVGMSYPMRQKRWTFFTEFAPIVDTAPITALGWGGGVGIRLYFGR